MPVTSNCYHGFLGVQEAEVIIRKSGQERGYLTRQSIIRPGFFILSFQEKGKVIHHVAPNQDGKYKGQIYDDAERVLNEMILGREECEKPLSPQNGPISEAPPSQNIQNQKCKACSQPHSSVFLPLLCRNMYTKSLKSII